MAAGVILVLLLVAGCGGPVNADSPPARVEVTPIEQAREEVHLRVADGDTLESVSRRVAGADWVAWRDGLMAVMDPRSLRPGMAVNGVKTPAGELAELTLTVDLRTRIRAWDEGGAVRSERVDRPLDRRVVRVEQRITSSLFGAVEAAGESPELAVRLAQIFQWDVDFFRDLRPEDSFTVVVDRQTVDGELYGYGEIFAARFVNRGRTLTAILYPGDGKRLGYYDLDGHPLRKQFLRAPLKFSRITSRFSLRRYHPILKRRMPHYGVDYGAPVGTPAHVTADGVVTFVGRKGGAGKMVTVRHPNGYQTNYLHLSRYGKGIRRGVRVHQGQVIGYVGQTGLATGPHLDYRVRHNGRWINPLRISSPPAPPIAKTMLARYLAHAIAVQSLLDGKEAPVGAAG